MLVLFLESKRIEFLLVWYHTILVIINIHRVVDKKRATNVFHKIYLLVLFP